VLVCVGVCSSPDGRVCSDLLVAFCGVAVVGTNVVLCVWLSGCCVVVFASDWCFGCEVVVMVWFDVGFVVCLVYCVLLVVVAWL